MIGLVITAMLLLLWLVTGWLVAKIILIVWIVFTILALLAEAWSRS